MKKALLIFDRHIDTADLSKQISLNGIGKIDLFPLTSERGINHEIENLIQSKDSGRIGMNMIESAELIDNEVDRIRERISQWSADLGNYKISGKPLKEWFMLPKKEVSTWWFSLFSEKNTLKTKVFFRIAQLGAIDKVISSRTFDVCVFSVQERDFTLAIEELCKRHSLAFYRTHQVKRKIGLKGRIKRYLEKRADCIPPVKHYCV